MDEIDREQRRLYSTLGYGWAVLHGTPRQVDWVEGWRETFITQTCLWVALKQAQFVPDEYTRRVQSLNRTYLDAMRGIRSAAWWLDHYKETRYAITPYVDAGMRRFIREAARTGAKEQQR